MIILDAYDVEIFPNFFSISIINVTSYLKVFEDVVDKKGKPIPLVQMLSVQEIKRRLDTVKKEKYWISDTNDSQLLPMIGALNGRAQHMLPETHEKVTTHMFSYNGLRYDKLMVACLLMNALMIDSTKELILKLYDTSQAIINSQDDREAMRKNYTISSLYKYKLPYVDVDLMQVFALNKANKMIDKEGNTTYFPKGLKQTSINLQWYQLLEYEMEPISEKDFHHYSKDFRYKGLEIDHLNKLISTWDRIVLPEWVDPIVAYNDNDVFILCEMVRLYLDEIKLRYNITKSYGVNVLNSSRSDISNKLFAKYYTEFSGVEERVWGRNKTIRTAMSFKRIISPLVKFTTPYMQAQLEEIRKLVIYSIGKDAFTKIIKINKTVYTMATGGIHSQDTPRELRSECYSKEDFSTGKLKRCSPIDDEWSNLTDDSFIYRHWDIVSFYPRLITVLRVAPAHMDRNIFVKLVTWLTDTRVRAKHSLEEYMEGVPKKILAEALKIVINAIYGKLGFEFGPIFDKLAVLNVTINGQLFILMQCEALEEAGIEVVSANTDGIVVKLYKRDKEKFERISKEWCDKTGLEADFEDLEAYINRDINNYIIREFNGKLTHKGALNPKMYAVDLSKGYDAPIVAQAVANYFLDKKPVLETLYECNNILDFCKTQNVGRQYHVELTVNGQRQSLQRNVRYYASNKGGIIEKVNNFDKSRGGLCAGQKVAVLNSLDDQRIEYRNIDYSYYNNECNKIIDPIKLGISPTTKGDKSKGTLSGKALLKKYAGMHKTLFDDNEE